MLNSPDPCVLLPFLPFGLYKTSCGIWYHLYFTKSNTPPRFKIIPIVPNSAKRLIYSLFFMLYLAYFMRLVYFCMFSDVFRVYRNSTSNYLCKVNNRNARTRCKIRSKLTMFNYMFNYMFKVNNGNNRTRCKLCSKLTMFNYIFNYMFKISNRNTRTRCKISSKLTIKTPERRLALLLTFWVYFTPWSSVSIVNFEYVIAGWEETSRVRWFNKSSKYYQEKTVGNLTGRNLGKDLQKTVQFLIASDQSHIFMNTIKRNITISHMFPTGSSVTDHTARSSKKNFFR